MRRSSIVFARSPLHLHHLQIEYLKARKIPLTRQVKRHITGHLRDALLYALEGGKKDTTGCCEFFFSSRDQGRRAEADAGRDAKMLEKTMSGAGTKDDLLIIRSVLSSLVLFSLLTGIAGSFARIGTSSDSAKSRRRTRPSTARRSRVR